MRYNVEMISRESTSRGNRDQARMATCERRVERYDDRCDAFHNAATTSENQCCDAAKRMTCMDNPMDEIQRHRARVYAREMAARGQHAQPEAVEAMAQFAGGSTNQRPNAARP